VDKRQMTSKERRKVIAESFMKQVGTREALRIRGRKEKDQTIWFGLGMIGVVGWSVAIPTLIGVAIGLWIDRTWPSRFSWTLMLLIGGVMVGCMNAWYWVRRGGTPTEPEEKG
jgi:ATP synthase protein I